nr:glycosyltransferase [candidate division Zixibacteria bacterium]
MTDKDKFPLKVLFITHNYPRQKGDYSGVFLHLLARKLRDYDIQVYVVAPHDKGCELKEEIEGIKIYRFRYALRSLETFAYSGGMHKGILFNPYKWYRLWRFLMAARKLSARVIESEGIAVVSIHWVAPNALVGKWLKEKYGDKIRLFLSSHGTDIRVLTKKPVIFRLLRSTIHRAEGWTVVSSFLKKLVAQKDSGAADKIEIIPLPNDETIFYPDDKIAEDPNLVVAVSRLTQQKRINYLLEAIRLASEKRPEIKLEIYGKGDERVEIERLIRELEIMNRVKICDPIPHEELSKVYNRAAVVVLNSIDEGFGLSLTEAMLCRTAVIGTKSGGITDIIEDNKTGLLVPVDNAEILSEKIVQLLEDSSLRLRLAEAGYQKAMEHYSCKSSVARYARWFKGEKT